MLHTYCLILKLAKASEENFIMNKGPNPKRFDAQK